MSQVTTLLKFAKATTNPQLASVLIQKAADLKSQVVLCFRYFCNVGAGVA